MDIEIHLSGKCSCNSQQKETADWLGWTAKGVFGNSKIKSYIYDLEHFFKFRVFDKLL